MSLSEIMSLVLALLGLAIMVGFIWMFIAGFFRSPFVPSSRKTVDKMLRLAKIQKGEKLVDLGCGDGRIVVRADTRYGAIATGYEISFPVWLLAQLNKLLWRSSATIRRGNLFQADLSEADVVTCYLLPAVMKRLAPIFKKELKPGARVVSAAFSMPDWQPTETHERADGCTQILIYTQSNT